MTKVLEVDSISKTYSNNRGIKDISFYLNKGDILGLLGPNGAGKSTLIKVIAGLVKQDKGSFIICGNNPETAYEDAMSQIGFVIETPPFHQDLTAYQHIKMAQRFYSASSKAEIEKVLFMSGLEKYKHEKIKNYSHGMKQKLGLSLAVLAKPALAILDEPFNGLDIESMVEMRDTIKTLSSQGDTTFIISSHLVHEVENLCNRIGIIREGKLISDNYLSSISKEQFPSLESYYLDTIRAFKGGS